MNLYEYWLHRGCVADIAVFFRKHIYTRIRVFYVYVYAHHYSYIYYLLLIVNNWQHWQQIVFRLVYICAFRVADFVALRVAVADYLLNIKIHRCIELYKNYFDFF